MIGGVPYFTGLLPDCPNTNPQQSAPCVQSRNKNNAGDVIVTFLAKGGQAASNLEAPATAAAKDLGFFRNTGFDCHLELARLSFQSCDFFRAENRTTLPKS